MQNSRNLHRSCNKSKEKIAMHFKVMLDKHTMQVTSKASYNNLLQIAGDHLELHY